MPAIILAVKCRLCPAQIPLSIAAQHGSEANGYTCEKCLAIEPAHLNQLSGEVGAFWAKDIEIDMGAAIAPPCARCGTWEGDTRVLEMEYEGRAALLCIPCGDWYLRANREKIRGTKLEWDLKLK
jgi:hypothetical protein